MSKLIILLIALFLVINVTAGEGGKENRQIAENVENAENILPRIRRTLQNPTKRESNKWNGRRRKKSRKDGRRSNDRKRIRGNSKKKNRGSKRKGIQDKFHKPKQNVKKSFRSKGKKYKRKEKNSSKKSKLRAKHRKNKKISSRQSPFCPVEKATALKLLYNQVLNFNKQLKRAKAHAKIVRNKKSKSTVFMKDALILTDIVGGNLSKPSCSSTSSNTRSASLASSAGSTLAGCSSSISTSCKEITLNTTLTGSCSSTMTAFESKVSDCRSAGCSCWTEAVAMKVDIVACNAVKEADSVKNKKKTCLKTFSGCKKAQDSAVEYTATCPAPATTSSTPTTSSPSPSSPSTSSPSSTTTATVGMETPVAMTMETPVPMMFETPVQMSFEMPVMMTTKTTVSSVLTTKAASRKDRMVKQYVAQSIRKYFK